MECTGEKDGIPEIGRAECQKEEGAGETYRKKISTIALEKTDSAEEEISAGAGIQEEGLAEEDSKCKQTKTLKTNSINSYMMLRSWA